MMRHWRAGTLLLLLVSQNTCTDSLLDGSRVGLPNRDQPVNLGRVTGDFRAHGGNAFINLTGFPNEAAVAVLASFGLEAPRSGIPHSEIVVYENLRLHVAWGYVPPKGVDRIAKLKFVTGIEPSADHIAFLLKPQRCCLAQLMLSSGSGRTMSSRSF